MTAPLPEARPLRRLRRSSQGDDAAPGECGDGQDLHDRRAHDPLRGRGDPADRPAARDHLHPHGDRRAARAGARAARHAPTTGWSTSSTAPPAIEDDELVQLLADGPRAEVVRRRDRLGKAVADFDAATIETTHGFCLQVLYGLGTAGDVDREVTLVEDVERPDGRGGRRPLPAQVRRPAQPAALHPRRGHGDRAQVVARPPRRGDRAAAVRAAGPALHPPAFRRGGARRDGAPQAGLEDPHLRRRAAAPPRDAGRPGAGARGLPAAARPLRRRAGRRVPGHRPGAVGHHARGVRPRAGRRSC